jgi:hypothetical protein
VAAPQLAAAHPALPADNPAVFTADGNLGHIQAVQATGSNDARGVVGTSDTSVGVSGSSNTSFGVIGASSSFIALAAAGNGRFKQNATIGHAGPPTAPDGSFIAGEQIRDSNWALWISTQGGTPGIWRQVAAVSPGFAGGSINLLPVAARLLDTRGVSPVAYHGTAQFQAVGVGGIPAGAVAVFGHLVAALAPGVNCGDGSSAILWPNGQPRPGAVNIVYDPQDLQGAYTGTLTLVAVGASGQISLFSQPINPVAVDYLFDAFGFVM